MDPTTAPAPRRRWAAGAASASTTASTTPPPDAATQALRLRLRQQRSPNVPLLDQHGRALRFYDDILKDQLVLVNVMYSACSNICTPAMRNLVEARQILGANAGPLRFVSLSLTPLSDPPEALRAFHRQHGLDEQWTLLTGEVAAMERLQRALGFLGPRDDDSLLNHSAMARLCDERRLRWNHVNTLLAPKSIARMIRFALA